MISVDTTTAQLEFIEVTDSVGIEPHEIEPGFGGGVSAFDYDDDGDVDLYLPQMFDSPDRLYRNNGDGTFVDVLSLIHI